MIPVPDKIKSGKNTGKTSSSKRGMFMIPVMVPVNGAMHWIWERGAQAASA